MSPAGVGIGSCHQLQAVRPGQGKSGRPGHLFPAPVELGGLSQQRPELPKEPRRTGEQGENDSPPATPCDQEGPEAQTSFSSIAGNGSCAGCIQSLSQKLGETKTSQVVGLGEIEGPRRTFSSIHLVKEE